MRRFSSFIRGWLGTLAFAAAFVPAAAHAAATLSLSPNGGDVTLGNNFTVKVLVDGAGASMNAVETTLTFDTSMLSVVSATKDGSVFSLWTTEPAYDNAKGTVTFGGGNPSPFSRTSTLASIVFRPLKEGSTKVSFSAGSVLAADGKGTDILGNMTPATFIIGARAAAPEPEPEEEPVPEDGGIVPDPPEIKSTTHPDENGWYNLTNGLFTWENLPDVTATRLALSSQPNAKPSVLYTPAIAEKALTDLEEGVWYLHAQLRNASGWGKASARKIQIDLTPPTAFSVSVGGASTSTQPTLLVSSTTDALSGLDRFEVVIGTEQPIKLKLEELAKGEYQIPPHGRGSYTVLVRAYDRAGNVTEATTSLLIEQDIVTTRVEEVVQVSFWQKYGTMIIILFLILVIIALLVMNTMQKSRLVREMRRGAKEAEEIRTKMEKIFSALKDEVEEQINALDKKPRLSDAEKRAIGKIKEAIDISEELINKEIEDVEKVLE